MSHQRTLPGPCLETSRLRLVPLTLEDLPRLHEHWSIPEVGRWLFDSEIPRLEKVEEELGQSVELFTERGLGIWGLYANGSGRLIGTCGFLPVVEIGEIEILFSLEPAYWRQGYGREASVAVLVWAFEEVGLETVVGRCDVPNVASSGLLESLGMVCEKQEPIRGIDCYHYRLTHEAFAR